MPENMVQVSREPSLQPGMAPAAHREASVGSRSKLIHEAAKQDLQHELESADRRRICACCCGHDSDLDDDDQGLCARILACFGTLICCTCVAAAAAA